MIVMTTPAVVPTLAAPGVENQSIGRFHHASSESRVSARQLYQVQGNRLNDAIRRCRQKQIYFFAEGGG
ncbi:MAG TPA: hypothetical protein VGH84_12805, partial [Steroidobacteraceae bacterium]